MMSAAVLFKLGAIFLTVALGWVAQRLGWLGRFGGGHEVARVLSNAAFHLFVPALLFRTMARIDLAAMPWPTLAAYFLPTVAFLLVVHRWQRRASHGLPPAGPATRAAGATYGNGVQLGIPMAAAMFGEPGLALHVALISLHGLVLLTLLTVLVELDLARSRPGGSLAATVRTTVRNALIHPVVLPVLLGLGWNLAGWPIPAVVDEVLATLGSAVVPVCLVLIGVSLASYGIRGQLRGGATLAALKLVALPALVLAVARFGFDLHGTPLTVLVMMAALPVGSNALIFAQRYRVLEAEATLAIVLSTFAFVLTAPAWLAVLALLAALAP